MIDKSYIINNGKNNKRDEVLFFQDDPVEYLNDGLDMYDILVISGIFSSKGEAKRNWKRTGREIPNGFSHFENIGKMNNSLAILNIL